MKTIKIFLASSSELIDDRKEFEIFIDRKNKEYIKADIFLELVLWEDFIDSMSATRLQDEYNKAIVGCDIFVSLFHTKVGIYTEEEFIKAYETFKSNGKPFIYTYFKDTAINLSRITHEISSLLNFKQKLVDLGHYPTIYADINELKFKFSEQLVKILPSLTGISQIIIKKFNEPVVIIQDIKGSTITLTVNTDMQEIRNDLAALKDLLKELKVRTFQVGKNIYTIAQINDDNFGFIIGKQKFNEWLLKNLLPNLQLYSKDAKLFLSKNSITKKWNDDIYIHARQIITSSYVGVVGIQLRKLISIGLEESLAELKQKNYIERCVFTVNTALELLCFTLISKLWDTQSLNYQLLKLEQSEALKLFFDDRFDQNLTSQSQFLQKLIEIYTDQNLDLPIPELNAWYKECENGFTKNCTTLQDIFEKGNYSLIECFDAEKHLTAILSSLNFLGRYRMVSMNEINYDETRTRPVRYLHNYTNLGYFNNEKKYCVEFNPIQVNYVETTVNTDAVLLYTEEYLEKESINLYPFVIDLNALSFEGGVKMCFYSSRHFRNENLLRYRFIENNNMEDIVFEDIQNSFNNDFNKLMVHPNLIKYKLDTVYLLFIEARNTILGQVNV